MINFEDRQAVRFPRPLVLAATIALVFAGCDSLLEVELPGSITEDSLNDPSQATVLVSSAIADIECAYSDLAATDAAGNEDVFFRVTGWWGGAHEYRETPSTTNCNTTENAYGWYTPLHKGRYVAERAFAALNEWEVENRERLQAQAGIYAGVAYNVLGDYFCEVTADKGPLMSPDETLAKAEDYLTKALANIQASGDFAIADGEVTTSARQMAHALRARVRFSRGPAHYADALADAAEVQEGFIAWVTREASGPRQRSNKVFSGNNENAYNTVNGVVTWWPLSNPQPIPFTGYRNLGILPDGRAVTDAGFAITTADAGAVADPRVPVLDTGQTSNGHALWTQQKYTSRDSDIPLVKWEEVWLIRAEIEGGQTAIDLVNDIRAHHGLPLVTYLSASDAEGIENLIIEERRRSLFLEARFWATKIQHKDKLWFPRGRDFTPAGHAYRNAVRVVMPDNEFDLHPDLSLSQQGSMCGDEAPAA